MSAQPVSNYIVALYIYVATLDYTNHCEQVVNRLSTLGENSVNRENKFKHLRTAVHLRVEANLPVLSFEKI